jgi:hypothetical protein
MLYPATALPPRASKTRTVPSFPVTMSEKMNKLLDFRRQSILADLLTQAPGINNNKPGDGSDFNPAEFHPASSAGCMPQAALKYAAPWIHLLASNSHVPLASLTRSSPSIHVLHSTPTQCNETSKIEPTIGPGFPGAVLACLKMTPASLALLAATQGRRALGAALKGRLDSSIVRGVSAPEEARVRTHSPETCTAGVLQADQAQSRTRNSQDATESVSPKNSQQHGPAQRPEASSQHSTRKRWTRNSQDATESVSPTNSPQHGPAQRPEAPSQHSTRKRSAETTKECQLPDGEVTRKRFVLSVACYFAAGLTGSCSFLAFQSSPSKFTENSC